MHYVAGVTIGQLASVVTKYLLSELLSVDSPLSDSCLALRDVGLSVGLSVPSYWNLNLWACPCGEPGSATCSCQTAQMSGYKDTWLYKHVVMQTGGYTSMWLYTGGAVIAVTCVVIQACGYILANSHPKN